MAECSDNSVSNSQNYQNQGCVTVPVDEKDDTKTEKAMDVKLIEDLREDDYPPTFVNVCEALHKKGTTLDRNDTIIVFFYIMMLEMGFVPKEKLNGLKEKIVDFNHKRVLSLAKGMPKKWKLNNFLYQMEFVLAPFPLHSCNIICSLNNDDIIVNCSVKNIRDSCYSMLVDPSQYIVSSATDLRARRFQNIRLLSNNFKTNIGFKAKCSILLEHNALVAVLQDMPPEILRMIFMYLDLDSTLRVMNSSPMFVAVGNQLLHRHSMRKYKAHMEKMQNTPRVRPSVDVSNRILMHHAQFLTRR